MKHIVNIIFSTLCLISIGGCTGMENEKLDLGQARKGELSVTARIYDEEWTTRSATTHKEAVASDTVYIDEDTYITAQTEPFCKSRLLAHADTVATQQQPATRGTLLSRSTDLKEFRVLFFDSSAENFTESTELKKEFKASYQSGAYSLAPMQVWASGTPSLYSFLAYTPLEGVNGITRDVDNRTLTYEAPDAIADQPDLCIAIPNLNQQNTEGSDKNQQDFVFHHALTAVGIAFRGYDVCITSATISGVKNKGKVSLIPTSTEDVATFTWSETSGSKTYSPEIKQEWGMHQWNSDWSNITTTDGYLMLPPQSFDDETAQLTITYEGRNNQKGGEIKVPLSKFGAWKAGHKVMYNIRLKTKPGITTDNLYIGTFMAGYTTSSPLSMSLAADDELTFTWTAEWLRVCRDKRTESPTNGYASGWKTGTGGPWNNIYFYATTNNNSNVANRTATVTVTGKKSGTSTFTVTQLRKWEPKLNATISAGWTPGSIDLIALTNPPTDLLKNISASATITGNDQFGISPTKWKYSASGKTLRVHYNRYNETYRFPVKVIYNVYGQEYVVTTTLVQKAPNGFIILYGDFSFRLALDAQDNGSFYAREWWGRCGSRVLSNDEFSALPPWTSQIKHKLNFVNGGDYWTDTTCNAFVAQKNWNVFVHHSGASLVIGYRDKSSIMRSKRYRCVRDLNGLTSRSGGTGW